MGLIIIKNWILLLKQSTVIIRSVILRSHYHSRGFSDNGTIFVFFFFIVTTIFWRIHSTAFFGWGLPIKKKHYTDISPPRKQKKNISIYLPSNENKIDAFFPLLFAVCRISCVCRLTPTKKHSVTESTYTIDTTYDFMLD